MTIGFPDPAPVDIQIERQVDQAIRDGHSLPRWGWARPAPYNAHSGAERIFGWQKMMIAERLGLLGKRGTCTVCAIRRADHRHTESYMRAMVSPSVCRSCHFHVHRRFRDPGRWMRFVAEVVVADSWATKIKPFELDRQTAIHIAHHPDIFTALAELPD